MSQNEDLWMDFIDKNPVTRGIQVAAEMSKREVGDMNLKSFNFIQLPKFEISIHKILKSLA